MIFRFLRTLFDIGLIRLTKRFFYESTIILEKLFPQKFTFFCLGFDSNKIPEWVEQKSIKKEYLIKKPLLSNYSGRIQFNFINQKRILKLPIIWNNSSWPRLYFNIFLVRNCGIV